MECEKRAESGQTVVLLLEDETGIRDSLRQYLQRLGHQVEAAVTVAQAMDILSRCTVSAAILDIQLGRGNESGLDVFSAIRREARTAELPVLIFTGSMLSPDISSFLKLWGAECFQKPVAYRQLAASLARQLRQIEAAEDGLSPDGLPVVDVPADNPDAQHPRPRQTVLIVEDDDQLRGVYRTALVCAGFEVREAADGLDALRQIDRNPPNGIVLDLLLPIVSGVVVRQEVASQPHTRHIPIIVVTGAAGNHDNLDVARLLTKPVSPDRLIEVVRECLKSAA